MRKIKRTGNINLYTHKARSFFAAVFALLITGCANLQPLSLPVEQTPAPAETALWNSLESIEANDWQALLNEGPTALDWRLRAIDSATESIDLQTFLWDFDTTGMLVLDHLLSAADRGVLVRILVDDTFLLAEDNILLALQEHQNIEYRVFNPYKRRSSGFLTRQVLNLAEFGRLDHRMHNKAMVVDNRIAIVGGRNLADEYFGLHGEANFRDLELIVGGKITLEVSAAFDAYWNDQWSFPIDLVSHVDASPVELEKILQIRNENVHVHAEESMQVMAAKWKELIASADTGRATLFVDKPPADNPADRGHAPEEIASELIALFENAEEEILIVSAYLIPTPDLEGAVQRAVERGVRVRILTNSIRSNNHLTAHSAYRKHIDELLRQGAELHEVRVDARDRHIYMLMPVERKTLALHAKALVIDRDKVFIGSANLDPRSLRINTEMGLLVESEAFNARVREAVETDYQQANAWHLQFEKDGKVVWVSDEKTLTSQPAASFMQRIEDWFFAHLPIEEEM